MQIKGTVTHVEIEGGFWGVLGDDGVPYHPVEGLPKEFCVEGLRISAKAKPFTGMSIFMWGRMVHVTSIQALTSQT